MQRFVTTNTLFYGDNFDALRQHADDQAVDRIYFDPPFNSNADYDVLYSNQQGTRWSAPPAPERGMARCVAGLEGKRYA